MRSPSPDGLVKRIVRIEEQIRQLRLRRTGGDNEPTVNDLTPYLASGWTVPFYGSNNNCGWYIHGGRCWLTGAAVWQPLTGTQQANLVPSSTPLPPETRPLNYDTAGSGVRYAYAIVPLHGDGSGFPAYRLNADGTFTEIDDLFGATAFMEVIDLVGGTGTYLQFPFGVTQGGRLWETPVAAPGNRYDNIPDGTYLILDGVSWPLASLEG